MQYGWRSWATCSARFRLRRGFKSIGMVGKVQAVRRLCSCNGLGRPWSQAELERWRKDQTVHALDKREHLRFRKFGSKCKHRAQVQAEERLRKVQQVYPAVFSWDVGWERARLTDGAWPLAESCARDWLIASSLGWRSKSCQKQLFSNVVQIAMCSRWKYETATK